VAEPDSPPECSSLEGSDGMANRVGLPTEMAVGTLEHVWSGGMNESAIGAAV